MRTCPRLNARNIAALTGPNQQAFQFFAAEIVRLNMDVTTEQLSVEAGEMEVTAATFSFRTGTLQVVEEADARRKRSFSQISKIVMVGKFFAPIKYLTLRIRE